MKTIWWYALGFVAVMVVVWFFMSALRWFNASTVQHRVIEPENGVKCVVVTTTDGAAVDCWSAGS